MSSEEPAHVAKRWEHLARSVRLVLLAAIAVDGCLIALRLATYPRFFAMPSALSYLIPLLVVLALYAAVHAGLPSLARRMPNAHAAVRIGVSVGLIAGALDLANILLESVLTLPQAAVSVTTGVAMLGLFALFAVAGFLGVRRTRSFGLGVGAAVTSAAVAILIVVTFGLVLVNIVLPKLAHDEVGDPEYLRSGWTDTRAFAIANTLDAGFTHLVEGPIIALVVGAVGSGFALLGPRRGGLVSEQAVTQQQTIGD